MRMHWPLYKRQAAKCWIAQPLGFCSSNLIIPSSSYHSAYFHYPCQVSYTPQQAPCPTKLTPSPVSNANLSTHHHTLCFLLRPSSSLFIASI